MIASLLSSLAAKLARLRDFGASPDLDRARWRPEALPIVRVYRVENDALIDRTIPQAEFFERSGCVVARLRRKGVLLEVGAELALQSGDLVAVFGVREQHGRARALLGPEVADPELLELRSETRGILLDDSVGYAGTYAFANVILAVAGGLLVRF